MNIIIMTSIVKLLLTKHQIKINNDNESFMIMNISSQNMIFVILTIIIMSTTFVFIMIKKGYKRLLSSISFDFDFQLLKDSIIFINHISRRDKFKRLKHHHHFSFFTNQDKLKRFCIFTSFIFLNIF